MHNALSQLRTHKHNKIVKRGNTYEHRKRNTACKRIHGADLGGTYDQNEKELTRAINNWIKAKGLENEYHVAQGTYLCKATNDENPQFAPRGYWRVMQICRKE